MPSFVYRPGVVVNLGAHTNYLVHARVRKLFKWNETAVQYEWFTFIIIHNDSFGSVGSH
jgi:hypothetical protein